MLQVLVLVMPVPTSNVSLGDANASDSMDFQHQAQRLESPNADTAGVAIV